jgi:hypothetical protein
MNRRELGKYFSGILPLYGISSSLPVAIAAADPAAPTVTRPRTESDDDVFHTVVAFDPGKQDFVVRGIYTLEADAAAHVDRLKGRHPVGSWISEANASIKVNRAWLQNHFIGERMGDLKDVLERLEARLMIDAHGV